MFLSYRNQSIDLQSQYDFYAIAASVMKELRYIKMITWFFFRNILTQGNLFRLFRRSCLWKINIFFTLRRSLCKKIYLQKFAKMHEEFFWKFGIYEFGIRKIGVLKNSPNFTGKYLCWSLFLI